MKFESLMLGFAVLVGAASAAPESGTRLRAASDGMATVEGRVLENNLGCTRDLPCYLRLDLAGEALHIVYHAGEYPPCVDRSVSKAGIRIRPGSRVRATGRYQHLRGRHEIDVCTAPGAVLAPLPPA